VAEALGVSCPTLRESLQQLIHEGLLVQVPHKGIHVAHPTPEELADIAEVRDALETMAALKLSRDPQGPAMDAVREALQVHLDALDSGDEDRSDITHIELHRRLVQLIEEGDEAAIMVEVREHIQASVDELIRRVGSTGGS